MPILLFAVSFVLLVTAGCETEEQEAVQADAVLSVPPDETTIACDDRRPLRRPYFGDLHVHTSYSFDAYAFETRNAPADAYDFARGAPVGLAPLGPDGKPTRELSIDRELDFAAVTDHAEFLGETEICTNADLPGYDSFSCAIYPSNGMLGFLLFGSSVKDISPTRLPFCQTSDCVLVAKAVWTKEINAANAAYDPCSFTSFPAYEWTGSVAEAGSGNLHRNVIFKGSDVPSEPVSFFEQPTPEGLWATLKANCRDWGNLCDVLAIPHNSNLSNGLMFSVEEPDGTPLTYEEALLRNGLEPLVEIYQHKGDSECRYTPLGGDELCGFEKQPSSSRTADLSFVREALKEGLVQQQKLGVNPFKTGIVGSTDTHNGTPGAVSEPGFVGHVGANDALPGARPLDFSPGGLAVVWAEQNSRSAIFDAMKRRETYGTSGPRIVLRFFGGWALPEDLCTKDGDTFVRTGYLRGVPMGADLRARPPSSGAPRIAVSALFDPTGAPLERIQIVKGWIDIFGNSRELVYDVAPVPVDASATVDLSTCEPQGPGHSGLCTVWTDPSFNPNRPAFYYARVVENPTCRWNAHECVRQGIDCGASVPEGFEYCCDSADKLMIQERAWSSPIWYTP